MPDLGLPLLMGTFTPQIMVTLFVRANASNNDVQFIRESVSMGRTILAKYGIGVAVIPPKGMNSSEQIGTFTTPGPLFEDGTDSAGRTRTIAPNGLAARTEVKAKMSVTTSAVVLFGGATAAGSRGYTEFNSNYPYFCMVSIDKGAKTTMLHEVGHCADMQHYMAYADLITKATMDEKNLMAEVADSKADARDTLTQTELDKFRTSYFFGALD